MVKANALDLEFDNSQYIDMGNQGLLDLPASGDWTIEGWFKIETLNANYQGICRKKWQLRLTFTGDPTTLGFYFWNGASWQGVTAGNWSVGVWYHVAIVFDDDNNQFTIYQNGVSLGDFAVSGNPVADPLTFKIGLAETCFDGLVQCIRISDNKRYTENFTPSTTLFESDVNTLGLWWLDDDLTDQSDNDFDGAFQGSGSAVYVEGTLDEVPPPPPPIGLSILGKSSAPTGYNCFIQQYVKNKFANKHPLKLPDGTLF